MAWIKTIPFENADPALKEIYLAFRSLYPGEYSEPVPNLVGPDGMDESISSAHSLIPEAMRHMMSGFGVLLAPHLPLSRRQQELIAAIVSLENQCFY
jgi:hypothetical protein